MVSDAAVVEKTGRSLAEWFTLLDGWGARDRPHKEVAAFLEDDEGVDAWWAQAVTVEYERARGLRDVGQRRGGLYEASVQRTFAAPPDIIEALVARVGSTLDARLAVAPRLSDTRQGRVLRYASEVGRVQVVLAPKGTDRTVFTVVEGLLPDLAAREAAKARWREVLDALRERIGQS